VKFVNIFFVILFFLSAMLQLNDSDSLLWAGIYLSGSLLCLLPLIGKGQPAFFWLALVFYLTYATYLFISPNGVLSWYSNHNAENIAQSMKAEKPWIEETREFFGLLILSSAAVLNMLFQKKE
jgi:hypothetical protein